MGCFSLGWFEQLLVWLVIIVAVIAIFKLLIPFILSQLGGSLGAAGNLVMAVVRIIIWAVVLIICIYICFALIECLIGMGGGLPLLPHGRL
jgi:hypothetical protein